MNAIQHAENITTQTLQLQNRPSYALHFRSKKNKIQIVALACNTLTQTLCSAFQHWA